MTTSLPLRAPAQSALALLVLATSAPAQNPIVDEGTFLLSRNGRAVGTEEFIIRHSVGGSEARIIATADIRIQPDTEVRHVSSALEVTADDLEVQAYQVKVSDGRRTELYMTLTGGRFQAKVVTPRGEELREYRARRGSVLLDDGVVHHYHFLAARALNGIAALPALVPREGRQTRLRITDLGRDRIQIAGRNLQARHLRVEDGDGAREVWVDDAGRLLRLLDHGSGLRAERKDLPG